MVDDQEDDGRRPRFAVYARHLSRKGDEASIERQLRMTEEYARANGWQVTAVCADRDCGGGRFGRLYFIKANRIAPRGGRGVSPRVEPKK